MRELIKSESALAYDDKARLFALMAWNGPEAAWHEYKFLVEDSQGVAGSKTNKSRQTGGKNNEISNGKFKKHVVHVSVGGVAVGKRA